MGAEYSIRLSVEFVFLARARTPDPELPRLLSRLLPDFLTTFGLFCWTRFGDGGDVVWPKAPNRFSLKE